MLLAANTCGNSTVLSRMKESFSVDLENTLTEICHKGNGSLMIVKRFCFSSSRMSVPLNTLSASVLFITGNTLFYGITQLEFSSFIHSLRVLDAFIGEGNVPSAFLDRSHTVGTHYLQCEFLQIK